MKKAICIFILLTMSVTAYSQEKQTMLNFDPAFVHNVYFWLHQPDNEQARAKFETALNKFLMASQYAKTKFVGVPPKATRDVVDDSFTYNLVVTFDSSAAQEAYQKEAPHLTFIEEAKDLWKKVIVYDANGLVK